MQHSTLALWRPRVPRCSAGKCPGPMRCLPMLKLHLFGMRGEGRSQSVSARRTLSQSGNAEGSGLPVCVCLLDIALATG